MDVILGILVKGSPVLTRDPCDSPRFVDPFDPWPTDPLSALVPTR